MDFNKLDLYKPAIDICEVLAFEFDDYNFTFRKGEDGTYYLFSADFYGWVIEDFDELVSSKNWEIFKKKVADYFLNEVGK